MTFRETGPRRHKIKAGFDLTPLVTVMLNLLIFFILSSTFVVQSSIQIQAPTAEGTVEFGAQDLSITLQTGGGGPDGKGRVYVNNDEVASWDALSERLAAAMRERPDARVLIRPDARIDAGRLITVIGIASKADVRYYAIETGTPKAPE
ncbi:MAG: biopolymer transporter ExbD [Candidatus Hydrogenedentes bacterium]|nr:biopolymer transporter ExbD [Candidatus Hydrogenedentota bacterium]